MAKGYTVGIASETKAFKQGVDSGIIEPLENAVDALDDLGKSKGPDQLERGFKDAQTASKKLEKETTETANDIEREFKAAYRSVKSSSADSTSAAKRDLAELGNEAKANAAETFASFDGSMASFADGLQGTLGGVVASLGPAGMVAGAAAALGLGFIMAGAEAAAEETERLHGIASALGQEYLNTGTIGKVSMDFLVKAVEDLATATGDGTDSLFGLNKYAELSGGSLEDLAQATGKTEEELRQLWREADKVADSYDAQADSMKVLTAADSIAQKQLALKADAMRLYRDQLGQSIGVAERAAEASRLAAEAGLPELRAKIEEEEALRQQQADAEQARLATRAAFVATVDQAYDDAAGAIEGYKAAEQPIFDPAAYVAAMDARTQALADYQTALASVNLSPEAKSFIDSQGVDAASAFLAGYQKATPEIQASLDRHWSEAAKENSGSYKTAIDNAFTDPIKPPLIEKPVVPAPDMSAVTTALSRKFQVKVEAVVVDRNGKRID